MSTLIIVGMVCAAAAGLIALYIHNKRHPMTPAEKQELEDEMRIW